MSILEQRIAAVLAEHEPRRFCEHGRRLCRCGFHLCDRKKGHYAFNQSDHQAEMVAALFTEQVALQVTWDNGNTSILTDPVDIRSVRKTTNPTLDDVTRWVTDWQPAWEPEGDR